MSPLPQGIYVASVAAVVYVRIVGRGACRNSGCLREYGQRKLQEGCRSVLVDLTQCHGMDSTFLGIFAGFGLALADSGRLTFINLEGENRRTVRDLGLDQMPCLDIAEPGPLPGAFPSDTDLQFLPGSDLTPIERSVNGRDRAVVMLESHENLCRINEGNEEKFREVKQLLRQDIARPRPGSTSAAPPPG